jgi:2-C-methyl-D-erythritol 4-phosphate cytidylyltransferase
VKPALERSGSVSVGVAATASTTGVKRAESLVVTVSDDARTIVHAALLDEMYWTASSATNVVSRSTVRCAPCLRPARVPASRYTVGPLM